jgi:choline dehydrogenase
MLLTFGIDGAECKRNLPVHQKSTRRKYMSSNVPGSVLTTHYDFIVCGSGSSGSVVAGRLAENRDVKVLLLEVGGDDNVPGVLEAGSWPTNLGSERDWGFAGQPDPHLNGRSVPLSMGKVLGGGSSINLMLWARGHKSDWDFFASEAGDPAWNYQSVVNLYRRIEDWHGKPDPDYRGVGGPLFVECAPNPHPMAVAMREGCRSIGIPVYETVNGRMMESEGGVSISEIRVRDGKRQSAFRSYVFPYFEHPNLTVLTHALVTRLIFDGKRAAGVEIVLEGEAHRIQATSEVILSLGAVNTPKVLMQSGVGDEAELRRFGIPVVQHLPGVGQNFQDHVGFDCVWESPDPFSPRNNFAEAMVFWKSSPEVDAPDLQIVQGEFFKSTPENIAKFQVPSNGWILFGGLERPKSRGKVRITGPNPNDPVQIETNFLSHPEDLKAAVSCIELAREIGNSAALKRFAKCEIMPGNLKGKDLEEYARNAASTYWHQTCTAKMGRDAMSVVDGNLKVYGIENLRIVDGSIMPRITTGNTMAPCIIIGERAAEILQTQYRL